MDRHIHIIKCRYARQIGMIRYFTGKPCPYGHIEERYISTRKCCECSRVEARIESAKNPEKSIAVLRDWEEKNKERKRQADKEWRYRNKERLSIAHKIYIQENKERVSIYKKEWLEKNRGVANASTKRYKTAKKNRIPGWADIDKITEYYLEARRLTDLTGINFNVDHIVPLQGHTVCGLHVENNLRIITERENKSKNNRLIEDLL